MKFTTITTTSLRLLLSVPFLTVFAAPLESRDVAVPKITYPVKGTVWITGDCHNVTWDTSNLPVNITNPEGQIKLRKGDRTTNTILADGFDIRLGRTEVTVPTVKDDIDYSLVLFGDSGNFSPKFTITSRLHGY